MEFVNAEKSLTRIYSPDNYTIRQTEEDFEYIWYDIEGAPQIVPLSERGKTQPR